jgi:hypothetical protein
MAPGTFPSIAFRNITFACALRLSCSSISAAVIAARGQTGAQFAQAIQPVHPPPRIQIRSDRDYPFVETMSSSEDHD